MGDKEVVLAVLQSDIALAGLVLVFSGFVLSKADRFDTRYGDKYKWLAAAWA